ncbi:MAG: 2-oxoglutarate/malate translocator [Firmicutes bacterium]|nr:2-oxoglutarate/malate translocator [Bacillota bacterium]
MISFLATTLKGSLGGVNNWVLGFLLVVLAYVYIHYFIASMTAHATAFFVPLGLVAVGMGAPVPLVVLVLGFMNSLNSGTTHYGSGPAPVFFGSGYIDQMSWWKNGLIVSVVHLVIWLGIGEIWWKVIGCGNRKVGRWPDLSHVIATAASSPRTSDTTPERPS